MRLLRWCTGACWTHDMDPNIYPYLCLHFQTLPWAQAVCVCV